MIALVALVTVLTAGSGSSGNRAGSSSRMAETTYAPKIDSATGVAHKNDATSVGRVQEVYVKGSAERVELIDIQKDKPPAQRCRMSNTSCPGKPSRSGDET